MFENKWPCKWENCSITFEQETDLFIHLKTHTQIAVEISCKWRDCDSTTVYNHRGHLNDHIIKHMSKSFVTIWCSGCNVAFRNRQSMHRHQRKSGCSGSFHQDGTASRRTSSLSSIPVVEYEVQELSVIFEKLHQKLSKLVKGRYLRDIEQSDEIKGM
jgi:hypothetical protein